MGLPLLVETRLEELGVKPPEKAADLPLGFIIPGDLLSRPYGLREGDELIGRFIEVYELVNGFPMADEALRGLWGTEAKFVVKPLLSGDYIFLHRDTWPILRDYGVVVPGRYVLKVEITMAVKVRTGEEIKIYPRRTVRA